VELAQIQEESRRQRAELEQARSHLDKLRTECKENATLKTELEKAREERGSFQKQAEGLSAEVETANQRVERLEAELKEAREFRHEADSMLSKAKGTVQELERKLASLEKVDAEAKEIREDRNEFKKKAAKADAMAAEATRRSEALQKQLEKAQNDIQRLKRDLESRTEISGELRKLLEVQSEKIEKGVRAQQEAAESMEKRLLNPILSRIDSSARQVESYIGLNAFLESGTLAPDLHGWPISPDLALYLMRLISRKNYDLIIEFGSGSSTVLMARAISEKLGQVKLQSPADGQARIALSSESRDRGIVENQYPANIRALAKELARTDVLPRIVAFEHKREYYEKTRADLEEAGLSDFVELVYSPLRDYKAPSGAQYLYYACEEVLSSLSNRLGDNGSRVLVFVDGPPANTGKHARYPALPLLLDQLVGVGLDVLMDDYIRDDESEIIQMWVQELDRRGYRKTVTTLPFEKGAALLEIG
jgi:predicted O-methyltransferase YrrM